MVTMSTVGYGDVVCVTALGRGFQVLFLLVGLVSDEMFYLRKLTPQLTTEEEKVFNINEVTFYWVTIILLL